MGFSTGECKVSPKQLAKILNDPQDISVNRVFFYSVILLLSASVVFVILLEWFDSEFSKLGWDVKKIVEIVAVLIAILSSIVSAGFVSSWINKTAISFIGALKKINHEGLVELLINQLSFFDDKYLDNLKVNFILQRSPHNNSVFQMCIKFDFWSKISSKEVIVGFNRALLAENGNNFEEHDHDKHKYISNINDLSTWNYYKEVLNSDEVESLDPYFEVPDVIKIGSIAHNAKSESGNNQVKYFTITQFKVGARVNISYVVKFPIEKEGYYYFKLPSPSKGVVFDLDYHTVDEDLSVHAIATLDPVVNKEAESLHSKKGHEVYSTPDWVYPSNCFTILWFNKKK